MLGPFLAKKEEVGVRNSIPRGKERKDQGKSKYSIEVKGGGEREKKGQGKVNDKWNGENVFWFPRRKRVVGQVIYFVHILMREEVREGRIRARNNVVALLNAA